MANELYHYPSHFYTQYSGYGGGDTTSFLILGKHPDFGECSGALRFLNVTLPKNGSVNYAELKLYAGLKGTGSSNLLKFVCYGIDEDNTGDFSANPFDRARTSVSVSIQTSLPGVGNYVNISIGNIINEIIGRSGWSSGNAIGFLLQNDGSGDNHWIIDISSSILAYRLNAEPNFTPTPKNISAPTFPTATSQGIKISKPGYNVLEATDEELLFTTRKKTIKVIAEKEIDCTAFGVYEIAHGLGYTPFVMGFAEGGGYRFKLNRDFDGASDPVGEGVQGYIWADDTNVYIQINKSNKVYYYVFIEEQSM